MVIADIQGTPPFLDGPSTLTTYFLGTASHVNGKDTMVLFDIMTHTAEG